MKYTTNYSKTITANNQTWSASDGAVDIVTTGTVAAVPDIQVVGNMSSTLYVLSVEPILEAGFETVTKWTFSTNGNIAGGNTTSYSPTEGTYAYHIYRTGEYFYNTYGQAVQSVELSGVDLISFDYRAVSTAGANWCTSVSVGGNVLFSRRVTEDTGWITETIDVSSYHGICEIKLAAGGCLGYAGSSVAAPYSLFDNFISKQTKISNSPQVYNISDPSTKCGVANNILLGAIHRINIDGTGSVSYSDDFTTERFVRGKAGSVNITHDTVNDELDIADDGYIYYLIDTKYPITGIPTLTTTVDITSGIPTIQISADAATWYDIGTAIVDDVSTVYNLDNVYMSANAAYDSPSTGITGITWDGTNIWSCDNNTNKIYKYNTDMTVNTAYDTPATYIYGLTWSGSNIWSCDATTDKIYKHNADMTVNTTYNAPGTNPSGLAWDGTNIWSCDNSADKIYKHNADMTVNTTYNAPSPYPFGLTWDGSNIWNCNPGSDVIYKLNADMTVNATYNAPNGNPYSLAWDGSNIWSCDFNTNKIYKHSNIDIHLNGLTSLYFRFDCVKAAAATCSIKTFQLDVNIDTTTATMPYIYYDTINTFQCDQSATSGLNCTVELEVEEDILQPIIIF